MLFYLELKKIILNSDFLKYILIFGAIAISICILYYGGKEVGKFFAEILR